MALWGGIPQAIQKAMAINPTAGSTFYDAEHVVFLMQENRSFDHAFASLQGVRGFNDPRAIRLKDGLPVWAQKDKDGNTYRPFHLDIKNTKATWMQDIPHSWENQVDARNGGLYDGWIEAKRSGRKEFSHVPLTMGYYTREDIPFYYAFADAFTVFDQHFCSALTGTTTNRMYFWTGKSRDPKTGFSVVRNSEATYGKEVDWSTYPERLEANGISWKVYQNEISVGTGLEGEPESFLANFTDNNLEWFKQYHVRYAKGHYAYLQELEPRLEKFIADLSKELETSSDAKKQSQLQQAKRKLQETREYLKNFPPHQFEQLPEFEKALHRKAFAINDGDPDFHQTETMVYEKDGDSFETMIPKGDILYQFRKDVKDGKLPTVSWLVAPQKFSDHPSAPWYGAWYLSEVMNILTENPEMWKKTIFILNYDENDGYFDHVPPFVAPNPNDPKTGKVSSGIDTSEEFVNMEEELRKPGMKSSNARQSPIGLGYRVPLIIASPWTRGGWVNSEVCDLTSALMFLENFLEKKTGKVIKEENISTWRRAICGDLTSAFRPFDGEKIEFPKAIEKNQFIQMIHQASFKDLPSNFSPLSASEVENLKSHGPQSDVIPKQEEGIRNSNPLGYGFVLDGEIDAKKQSFRLTIFNHKEQFGEKTLGVPLHVYSMKPYLDEGKRYPMKIWSFAVEAGSELSYDWPLGNFADNSYQIDVFGPNGYYRSFKGSTTESIAEINVRTEISNPESPKLILEVFNHHPKSAFTFVLEDQGYGKARQEFEIEENRSKKVILETPGSFGWYDFALTIKGNESFERKFAGRIETGKPTKTDPQMGFLSQKTQLV